MLVQTAPTQWLPAQQSASAAQAIPAGWQMHRPAVHGVSPQQSVPMVHTLLTSRQHTGDIVVVYARHDCPAQQVATELHAPPGIVHVDTVPHTPPLQVSPAQQSVGEKHDPPDPWQVGGVLQTPP